MRSVVVVVSDVIAIVIVIVDVNVVGDVLGDVLGDERRALDGGDGVIDSARARRTARPSCAFTCSNDRALERPRVRTTA